MSDLSKLRKFLDAPYRESYLDGYVKGSIAYQIKAIREALGLNQTEFGRLIGKPQSVVSRLESEEYGAANVTTLLQIANRLKVGLRIQFCNFETILSGDLSPSAMSVENIDQTLERLTKTKTTTKTYAAIISVGESTTSWQTTAIVNQPLQPFQGPETLTMWTSTQTPPIPLSVPLT